MVSFTRTLGEAEIRGKYLNLTDDSGTSHGQAFPSHQTRFVVIDHYGRKTAAQMHHEWQVWGALYQWYEANDPQVSDKVEVTYDPAESEDSLAVLHLRLL